MERGRETSFNKLSFGQPFEFGGRVYVKVGEAAALDARLRPCGFSPLSGVFPVEVPE